MAMVGMTIRPIRPDDAIVLAKSLYESFTTFNKSVQIPPHLDFPSADFSQKVVQQMTSIPGMHGVLVENQSSGALMAAGFMTPGDVYAIGPVWADDAFKGRGGGKAVMTTLIEQAKSKNAKSIRLNQVAANFTSFGLYASLGMAPVECWHDLEGSVTEEQSALACRSVGIQPLTGVQLRKMEAEDVETCNKLHIKSNGFSRTEEISMSIRTGDSWVLLRDGEIIAYSTGFNLMGHIVAQTEEAFVSLVTEACLQRPSSSPLATLHLPGRLYPRLLQWALAAKLRFHRSCWLMVIGSYQAPQHGMVYCPGIKA